MFVKSICKFVCNEGGVFMSTIRIIFFKLLGMVVGSFLTIYSISLFILPISYFLIDNFSTEYPIIFRVLLVLAAGSLFELIASFYYRNKAVKEPARVEEFARAYFKKKLLYYLCNKNMMEYYIERYKKRWLDDIASHK